jgi:hypothetical protein
METNPISQFRKYFEALHQSSIDDLNKFYHPDIRFHDPINTLHGLDQVKAHFIKLNANLHHGSLTFNEIIRDGNQCALSYTMNLNIRKPAKSIAVPGCCTLKISKGLIIEHTDYFDLGLLIYEHIPLIGIIIKKLKRKF